MNKIHAASSCWSTYKLEDAINNIYTGKTQEPLLGVISHEHIQICPQHSGYLDESTLEFLKQTYFETNFRLHSDVRLKNKRGFSIDLSDFSQDTTWYFKTLAHYSKILGASAYTLHAGKRICSLKQLHDKFLYVQEIFGDIQVGIEGLYPFGNNKWLISSWEEYEWMAENNISYALDLSHLNIVANKFGTNSKLIKQLISNHLCIEVHISFNEGHLDNHLIGNEAYYDLFKEYNEFLNHKNMDAIIFTEGNQLLNLRKKTNE